MLSLALDGTSALRLLPPAHSSTKFTSFENISYGFIGVWVFFWIGTFFYDFFFQGDRRSWHPRVGLGSRILESQRPWLPVIPVLLEGIQFLAIAFAPNVPWSKSSSLDKIPSVFRAFLLRFDEQSSLEVTIVLIEYVIFISIFFPIFFNVAIFFDGRFDMIFVTAGLTFYVQLFTAISCSFSELYGAVIPPIEGDSFISPDCYARLERNERNDALFLTFSYMILSSVASYSKANVIALAERGIQEHIFAVSIRQNCKWILAMTYVLMGVFVGDAGTLLHCYVLIISVILAIDLFSRPCTCELVNEVRILVDVVCLAAGLCGLWAVSENPRTASDWSSVPLVGFLVVTIAVLLCSPLWLRWRCGKVSARLLAQQQEGRNDGSGENDAGADDAVAAHRAAVFEEDVNRMISEAIYMAELGDQARQQSTSGAGPSVFGRVPSGADAANAESHGSDVSSISSSLSSRSSSPDGVQPGVSADASGGIGERGRSGEGRATPPPRQAGGGAIAPVASAQASDGVRPARSRSLQSTSTRSTTMSERQQGSSETLDPPAQSSWRTSAEYTNTETHTGRVSNSSASESVGSSPSADARAPEVVSTDDMQ